MNMKYILCFSIPLLLFSCSDAKLLQKSLNKYQVPIDYLHDTEIVGCDKTISILLGSFENQVFDSSTSVTTISHKLLPFIIYNYEETNLAVNLGQNSIEQDYSDFFKESFKKESQRTGCYSLTDEVDNNDYVLQIRFDTCRTKSQYQTKGVLLFLLVAFGVSVQEIGFPSETDLNVNVKLVKENTLIFENKYSINRMQPFINVQTRDVEKLRSDFLTNMAESLSLSTKECIQRIVQDINQVIVR